MNLTGKRIGSLLLSVCMVFTLLPTVAFAETEVRDSGVPLGISGEIIAFAELDTDVAEQTVEAGTEESELALPGTLTVTVTTGSAITATVSGDETATGSDAQELEEQQEEIETIVAVSGWTSDPDYDSVTEGVYTFTPALNLPESITIAEGVTPPQITVTVNAPAASARFGSFSSFGIMSLAADGNSATIDISADLSGDVTGSVWSYNDTTKTIDLSAPVTITGTATGRSDTLVIATNGNTVTLDNMTLLTSDVTAVEFTDDAELILSGTSTITSEYSGSDATIGIWAAGSLTISGSGTLNATGGTSTNDGSLGIFVDGGDFNMDGGTVNATGGTSTNGSYGIFARESFNMSDGTVTAAGGDDSSYSSIGIEFVNFLNISDGMVTASGNTKAFGGAPTLTAVASTHKVTYSTDQTGAGGTEANADGYTWVTGHKYVKIEEGRVGPGPSDIAINAANFPDANFRTWLQSQSFGSDNVLTAAEIAAVTSMNVSSQSISDLTGIGYFTELTVLYCFSNNLTELPELPDGLIELACGNNNLTELPELPDGLTGLACNNNNLTELPELPDGLTGLDCNNNNLTELPELPDGLEFLTCISNNLMALPALPAGLTNLDCSYNGLTALALNNSATYTSIDVRYNNIPNEGAVTGNSITWDDVDFIFAPQKSPGDIVINVANFPDANFRAWLQSQSFGSDYILTAAEIAAVTSMNVSNQNISNLTGIGYFTALTTLRCNNNSLTELPELPAGLTELRCGNNNLTALLDLPAGLIELWCDSNSLTELPTLPTGLTVLYCNGNNLTALPSLPTGLSWLECAFNNLTALPTLLTGLGTLNCSSNNLTALPELPTGLEALYCSNNSLTALPTLPAGLTVLYCNGNNLTALALNSSATYTYINVSYNNMGSTGAVTGNSIAWDGMDFIFAPQRTPVTFTATQTGGTSGTADSTGITLTFSEAVTGLTADKITITSGTGSAVKGALSGSGTTWTIDLASITVQGDVNVSVADFGTFHATPASQPVAVYKAGGGTTTYTVAVNGSYAGTTGAGSYAQGATVTIAAGSRSNYSFNGWTASGVTLASPGSASTTFTMPANNVSVTAGWNYTGGSGDSGGGSSSGGSTTTPTTTTPEKKPDQPVTASAPVTATAGTGGTASAVISDKTITDAIAKAQADAKAQGKTANGTSVALDITMPKGATSLTTTLTQSSLNSLVSAGVTSLEINGAPVSLGLDLNALKEIQKQSGGNITISFTPAKGLSNEAKALLGNRPVYNITISYVKDGKPVNITSLGSGTATLSIPYTPGKNEAVGYLFGVYVDANGKPVRIDGSAYDANSGSLLIPTGHFSVYGVGYTAPSAKFTDISTHWGKEAIDYVVGRGLLSGTSETTFAPDTAMTRGMLVTALGRLANVDTKAYTTNSFTDVKADSAFRPYIEWAYKKGVVQGIGNQQFAPDRAITREEIAVIFANFAKATGYTMPVTREATTYADAASIGSVYKTAVTAMQQAGIMMGGTGNKFNPKASATRAEVSSMLHRYIKLTIDPATAQGWAKNDAGQYLYYKDGKAVTGTQTIDGVKYFFETTGVLKTGWVKDGNNWKFYSGNKLLTGWWNIGSDVGKKTYYFDTNGNMVSGKWLQIDGKWYYFYTDGSLAVSTKIDEYEVDENGVRKTK